MKGVEPLPAHQGLRSDLLRQGATVLSPVVRSRGCSVPLRPSPALQPVSAEPVPPASIRFSVGATCGKAVA